MERKESSHPQDARRRQSNAGRLAFRAPVHSAELTAPRLDDRLLDDVLATPPEEAPEGEPLPLPAPPEEARLAGDPLADLEEPRFERRTVTGLGSQRLHGDGPAESGALWATPGAQVADAPSVSDPEEPTVLARPAGAAGRGAGADAAEPEPRDPVPTSPWSQQSSERSAVDLPPGARLVGQRYLIEEEIGTGGMSRIFRVSHVGMGREFALKIISADLAAEPRMRNHFDREAQVLSRMEHPNIVQITDFGVDDALGAYIVMELLRGETLLDRLRRHRRLALSLALDLATQVADAIAYIHERDLVHCDIKAENVLLCQPQGAQRQRLAVKLIDFGLSRTKAFGAQLNRAEVGGTPQYMAPEQIRGQAPTPSMDIYSLGVLLYEMVTGRLPFTGEVKAVLSAHLHDAPPPPSQFTREPLDEALESLILKALAKDPAQRQPSMMRFLYELRTVTDMLGLGRQRGSTLTGAHELPVATHSHCQLCPFPMFRLDLQGRIIMSNPAFARFVRGEVETLFGCAVQETRLASIYADLPGALGEVQRGGGTVQRVLRFRPTGQDPVVLLSSLVAEKAEDGQVRSVIGLIVPLDEQSVTVTEVG